YTVPARPAPSSTLLPYTTLFRSGLAEKAVATCRQHFFLQPAEIIDVGIDRIDRNHTGGARCNQAEVAGKQVRAVEFPVSSVPQGDRKSTRLNSSHQIISYAVFCL